MSYRTVTDVNGLLFAGFLAGSTLSRILAQTSHVEEKPAQTASAVSPQAHKEKVIANEKSSIASPL
jgi:hypothetical protein